MRIFTLDWYIEKYGKDKGEEEYISRNKKLRKPKKNYKIARKNYIERFLNYKVVRNQIGDNYSLSIEQRNALENWFTKYEFKACRDWFKQLAIWITIPVYNLIERRIKLVSNNASSHTLKNCILRFGDEEGKIKYDKIVTQLESVSKNRPLYWKNLGFTEEQIKKEIIKQQTSRSIKGVITKNKTPNYFKERSKRCLEYWIKTGLNKDEAIEAVSKYQTRDITYFSDKYGIINGKVIFDKSKNKRKQTWANKTHQELMAHAKIAIPKKYDPFSQEMKAINSFINANNIDIAFCKFGSPKDQFYQYIPLCGFRRYDLAVFHDVDQTQLKMILEYHGPGHINFSDYNENLKDEYITCKGRKLTHLGTYGKVFQNDLDKRNHILENFKDVDYIIMWHDDFKNRRFKIDLLSKSRKN